MEWSSRQSLLIAVRVHICSTVLKRNLVQNGSLFNISTLFDTIASGNQDLIWFFSIVDRPTSWKFIVARHAAVNAVFSFCTFVGVFTTTWTSVKKEKTRVVLLFSLCFQFLQFLCVTSALNRSCAIGLCLWKSGICPSYASGRSPGQRREQGARLRALPRQQTTVQQVVMCVSVSVCLREWQEGPERATGNISINSVFASVWEIAVRRDGNV